jgi:putative endonuclease
MFYSYILKSEKDGRYYYGSTSNLEARLLKHNQGGVPSTKHRRPFVLHYAEVFGSKSAALQRERFYKSVDGYRFLKEKGII